MEEANALVVRLLGPPRVRWREGDLVLPRRQVRALLYRLAVTLEPVPRDVLATLFWPQVPTDTAHTNLSRLLHLLQRGLPDPSLLRREGEHIRLDPTRVWSDTHALAEVLDRPHASLTDLRRAGRFYRGPFLDGFFLPRASEFDHWLAQERRTWERHYLRLLALLVDREERLGHYAAAIRWAQRYLEIDELSEAMHRRLILLYAAIGDRDAAVRQFQRCVTVLERELGVSPLPETRAAYDLARGRRPSVPVPPRPWRPPTPVDTPFVGREAALDTLYRAYMRARTGQTALVFVRGEAGIGKTRLLQEFTATLPRETRVLTLAGSETARDVPFAVLAETLHQVLTPAVRDTLRLPAEVYRALTWMLLSEPLPPEEADASPGQERTRVYRALNVLFDALCYRYPPLVLCVDDLHYLDESTGHWLAAWLGRPGARPLLLVATYRPEERAGIAPWLSALSRHHRAETIALEGLTEEAVAVLAQSFLGTKMPAEALRVLHRFTGGNPLFLVETIYGLLEAQQTREAPPWETLPLPGSLQEAVRRRLSRLAPLSYHVLEAAAVLADDLSLDLLRETSGYMEEEVAAALEDLVARGLLREEGHDYRFAHQVVREVVYRDILYGRRRLLHRRAAHALQHLAPQNPARIAHHFQQGEQWEEAVTYWLRAGDQARLRFAATEAVRHYERALALQRELGDEEGAARTLMRLGLAHHLAFDFSQAWAAYNEGFSLWQQVQATAWSRLPAAAQPLRVDWPYLRTLDPALARDANSGGVIEHLFRGLAEWSPEMNVLPDLARGWDVLAQGRQYIFYLHEDAVWSDGYPVTAQDIVTAWQRVLHPTSTSPFVRLLFPIRNAVPYHRGDITDPHLLGVRALDDLTLVVELERPCAFFLHLMAHPVTRPIPAHRWQQEGERWWHPDRLVTCGPFDLVSWQWGKEVVLTRAAAYRGRWPGNVEEIVLHLGVDGARKEDKWRLYGEGRLDIFTLRWGLPPDRMAHIRRRFSVEFLSVPDFFVRFLAFRVDMPPFHRRDVRRAFALATNRHTVAALMGGDLRPAHGGLIPPDMPGHTPHAGPTFDPLTAQATLAAAGYPQGRGFPEVTLLVFEAMRPVGEYLQQAWQRILHVPVRLEVVPWDDYLLRLEDDARPHLFIVGWVADYPDPDSFLRVSRLQEWTGWHHPTYTTLLDRALVSHDPEERITLYQQADHLLLEELPILPLVYSGWAFLIKPRVRTFPVSPLKWWFWKDVVVEG